MDEVQNVLDDFRNQRDWERSVRPDSAVNLSKSILIEATELLEHFQWSMRVYDLDEVKYEIADIYIYLLGLANHLGFELDQLALDKLGINEDRFPAPRQ